MLKSMCLGVALSCLSSMSLSAEISIRADEWYPMNGDPSANKPGYMIELAKAIFANHGYSVDYRIMPWERAINEVRGGNADCVVGAYKDDAPDFAFPQEPWGVDAAQVYVKKGNPWRYNGLESLSDQSVGVIGGY